MARARGEARRRTATDQQPLVSRIKALAEALEGSDIGELELTEHGTRLFIRRRLDVPAPLIAHTSAHASGRAAANGLHAAYGSRPSLAPETAPAPEPGSAIISPLTGVFYASPSPSSAPFAQVGDLVQAGQVVCIVEAMKVFNEIKAEVSGTVLAVLAQSGQLVRKGDALLRVQAS
ncbi:MAG TPA: acetyl-CoA carboxylase biotin carboxyl carrier protein [Ktedonobacterales bacterium]|jgi:acetyl-CoA carboxylase biotin carboxyl carrier protein